MRLTGITQEQERAVVERLLRGESLAQVAMTVGIHRHRVEETAAWSGYPDTDKMRAALADLPGGDHPAAAADAADAVPARELARVAVADLHPDPDNLRADVGDVSELAATMREVGLLQPIVARRSGPRLVIVAGHRRHAAAQLLGWETVECVIHAPMSADDVLVAMLVENGQRAALDPIEEARAINRMRKARGMSSVEVGAQLGRSQSWVDMRLSLLDLPTAWQDKVRRGEVGATHAAAVAREKAGKTRPAHARWHLSDAHPLAARVRARCRSEHPKGARMVGSVGCGACWEGVIRIDERRQLQDALAATDRCPTCGTDHAAAAGCAS